MASRKTDRDADKTRPQREQPSRNNTLNVNPPMEGYPRTEHVSATSTESISLPQLENLIIICSTSSTLTTSRGLVPLSQSELNLSSGRTHSSTMVPEVSLSKNQRFATTPLPCTIELEESQSGSSVLRSNFADKRGTLQTVQEKVKSQPHPRVRRTTVLDTTRATAPAKRTTRDLITTRSTKTVLKPAIVMIIERPKPESSKKPSGNQTTLKKGFLPRPSRIPVLSTSYKSNLAKREKTNSSGTTIKTYHLPVATCSTRGVRIICTGSTCPPCIASFLTGGSITSASRVINTSTTLPPRLSPVVTNTSKIPRATTYVVDSITGPLSSLSVSSPGRVMLRPRNEIETETVSAESISCELSTNLLSGFASITEALAPTTLSILDIPITPLKLLNKPMEPIVLNPRKFKMVDIPSPDAATSEVIPANNLSSEDMSINPSIVPTFPRRFKLVEISSPEASTTEAIAPTNLSILDMPITPRKLLKKPMEPIVLNPRRFVMTNIPSPASTISSSEDMPINIYMQENYTGRQVSSRVGFELISSEGEANNDIELPEQSAQGRLESYLSSAHRQGGRHDGDESDTD